MEISAMENWYLIVGLGNPGRQYAQTRHNAGFMVVEQLAQRWKADWATEKRFSCRLARLERAEKRIMLCLPETYMNASGESVGALARYQKVPVSQVLVVVDDADLALG